MKIEISDTERWREADVKVTFTDEIDERLSSAHTVSLTLADLRQLRDKIDAYLGEDILGDETCEECESTGVNCDLHRDNAAEQERRERAAGR